MRASARKLNRRETLSAIAGALAAGWVVPGRPAAAAQAAPLVNYRVPRRAYVAVKVGGRSFQVEKSLQTTDKALAAEAMARLVKNADHALETFPKLAADGLRHLNYFLMHGPKASGGGKTNGLEYIQADAPVYHPELDPRWGDSMVVYCARNYVDISDLWAAKAVVHEYGHAYQLRNWPEKQPEIVRTYTNAMDRGLYRKVKDVDGRILDKAYATTNQLEYFAELTAMYFARGNYEPFDRHGLKDYDPAGYAMIEQFWRVGEGASRKAPPKKAKRARR